MLVIDELGKKMGQVFPSFLQEEMEAFFQFFNLELNNWYGLELPKLNGLYNMLLKLYDLGLSLVFVK